MRHAQIIKHQVKYIKAKYWADAGVQVARDWLERGGHGTIGIGTSAFVDYTTLPSPPANGADWTNLPVPITGATENEIGMTITIEVFNVGTGQTDDTADYRIGSTVYYER
ncbi:hypothetical protein KJ680_14290 [bacterium]|nr:hypothetical protein [bacterium]